jgi:2-oxoglutarate ferredoxin oxidoreductase subunit alpha
MTVEGTWSDQLDDELVDADNRRYSPLAMMLRSRYLVDVDCWTQARGQPIKPSTVVATLRAKLDAVAP